MLGGIRIYSFDIRQVMGGDVFVNEETMKKYSHCDGMRKMKEGVNPIIKTLLLLLTEFDPPQTTCRNVIFDETDVLKLSRVLKLF